MFLHESSHDSSRLPHDMPHDVPRDSFAFCDVLSVTVSQTGNGAVSSVSAQALVSSDRSSVVSARAKR